MLSDEEIIKLRQQYNIAPAGGIKPSIKSITPVTPTMPTKKTDVSNFTKFATGVGKGVVSTIRGAGTLGEKMLQAPLKAAGVDFGVETGAEKLIPKEVVEPKGTAETVGYWGEQIGEFFIPWSKIAKLPSAVGKLKTIPKIIEEAGDFVLRSSVQQGEVKKEDVIGGLALGGAFRVGSKAFKTITEKFPERIIQGILKQPKKEIKAGKDVAEYVLENKKIGSVDQLFDDAVNSVIDLSKQIQKNLANYKVKDVFVNRNEIYKKVQQKFTDSGIGLTKINEIVSQLSPQASNLLKSSRLSLPQANRLRQLIDETLGDRAFLGSQLPFNKEILKSFNTFLRESVKEKAPEGTRKLFDILSKEITLRNSLDNVLSSGKGNRIFGLTDLLTIGGGGAAFGAPGAIVATASKKVAETPQVRMATAKTLNAIKKLEELKNKVPDALKGLVNEIMDAFSD